MNIQCMRYHPITKNNIAHCGNIKQYKILILTAEFHEFLIYSKLLKYYFYISAGGLGTAMEYLNDIK